MLMIREIIVLDFGDEATSPYDFQEQDKKQTIPVSVYVVNAVFVLDVVKTVG